MTKRLAVASPASMAGGSVLPGPEAVRRGEDWETWARRNVAAHGC